MPFLAEFDAQTVRPSASPKPHTSGSVCFPRPLVAHPRLPHGIRALDVGKNATIRVKSTLPYFTNTWADCHIDTWDDTTLYSAVDNILVLAPGDIDFLSGEHMRKSDGPPTVRVNFDRPFVTPPRVVAFLNLIDLGKDRNWRLSVSTSAIDSKGFTLHIETWGNSVLHGARACWIAYPEDREHIFSASVNTMDLGRVARSQSQTSKDISFGAVEFWKNPSVFVALNFLDVDCKANLRINAYVDGVSKTGLVCHIDTWDDTVLYAAGVSIIAFN